MAKMVNSPDSTPDPVQEQNTALTSEYDAASIHAPAEPPHSGDFHAATILPDGSVAVVVGDVIGHGEEASEHATRLRNAVVETLAEGLPPNEALGFINAAAEMDEDFQGFATVFAGVIEPETGKLTYASGGHEPALLSIPSADGELAMVEELKISGMPLGVSGGDEIHYDSKETTIPEGGTLLLYTDGVSESRREKTFLGSERIRSLFGRLAFLSPLRLVRRIFEYVRHFVGRDKPLHDDTTILALHRKGAQDQPEITDSNTNRGISSTQSKTPET